jgi:hypothetical protein
MAGMTMAGAARARLLLQGWLAHRLPAAAAAWLDDASRQIAAGAADGAFNLAVSQAGRRTGRDDLRPTPAELAEAAAIRPGWDPVDWSVDQAARLVLVLAASDRPGFADRLEQLFITADVGELVAFYRGLPLYPEPAQWLARAGEGARSNMRAVFQAVAHRNPYPAEAFPEAAWNQLVLKALFIGAPLAPILGLDARQNPALMRMLCDYAHERWAAGRPVSPELWRCVGRFADAPALADLARVLATGQPGEQAAAALALTDCPAAAARPILAGHADLARQAADGRLTWAAIAPTS